MALIKFPVSETGNKHYSCGITKVPSIAQRTISAGTLDSRPVNLHIHAPGVRCPGCESLELEAMQDSFAELTFSQAFSIWIEAHRPYIQDRTLRDYYQYGNALMDFFGPMQLKNINIGNVRGFQRWRSHVLPDGALNELPLDSILCTSKYRHSAGNVRIKNEINSVLKPMLREAGVWHEIEKKKFKHLPVPREGSGIALSKEQWREIFEIAFANPRWELAGHCLQIMFRGGFGFGELRKVRRKDLDLEASRLRIVEGAKNGERERTVNLVPSALESAKWLVERWKRLDGTKSDEYLLPHRKDHNRPMRSINCAWNQIKREWAKRPQSRPEVRQYDARVSAASLLLSNPSLSLPTIEKALGWTPSSAMRKRYYRAEQNVLLDALHTLEDAC